MAEVNFVRHSAWVSQSDLTEVVTIIGCGAVGSHVALCAAKMGCTKFRLFDADTVEEHNLPNQAFCLKHVGMEKTTALAEVLKEFNPQIEVETHNTFFTTAEHKDLIEGPLVIATDSMSSRSDLLTAFTENYNISGVFEIRLGFDYGYVNVVDNLSKIACDKWAATLLPDSAVPEGPCNQKICTTLVQMTSALLVHKMCERARTARLEEAWEFVPSTYFDVSAGTFKILSLK